MEVKLMIFAFFFLIRHLRVHYVWNRCAREEGNTYRDRDNFRSGKCSDEAAVTNIILLGLLYLYLFKESTPTILQISIGFIIIILGAIYASIGRMHLNGSWAELYEITTDITPLVTSGVYALVRNPIYVGLLVMLIGYGISMGITQFRLDTSIVALGYFICKTLDFHKEILAEEKFLSKRHGEKFQIYYLNSGRYLPKLLRVKPITTICIEGE